MSETERNLESALAKFTNLSKRGFDKARETIGQSAHTVKVKIDVTSLAREKRHLLEELGKEVVDAIKAGKLRSKLFDENISNIDDIEKKINEKEEELLQIGETPPAVEKKAEQAKTEEKK